MCAAGELDWFPKRRVNAFAGDAALPNIYSLKGRRKPINDKHLYGHEMDCADCFIQARTAAGEKLVRWERYVDLNKPLKDVYRKYKYRPDRIFEHEDIDEVFHLEHDTGSEEDLEKYIAAKCEAFIRLSDTYSDQNMMMLFTCKKYRYDQDDNDRANKVWSVVSRYKRGNQILIARHARFLTEDPFADPIWVNAKGQHVALNAL